MIDMGGTHKLRPATSADLAKIAEWIAQDQDHAGKVAAEFFTVNDVDLGINSCAVMDENGDCFFIRFEKILRLHIQHAPTRTAEERERQRDAMTVGMGWLAGRAKFLGVTQFIFESTVQPLIRFCEKRLGYKQSPYELLLDVTPKPAEKAVL